MPIYRTPIVTPTVAYSSQITGGKPFGTTSGKIEFYSTYLATTDLTQTKYGGTIAPYAVYQDIAEGYYDPKVTKYPLMCFSPHSRYRMHSWQDGDPMLNTDVYRHSLWINVADANARGIKDGDTVTVSNDVGTVQVPAYVTSKIVPGTVNLFQGGWFTSNSSGVDTRGAPNYLNPDTTNPDGQWPFHGLVEVKKS
jgi:anaerobic dimethyl sulfoxide reductase subunit A